MIFNPVVVGAILVQGVVAKSSRIAGAIAGYAITTGIMLWGFSIYSDGAQIAFFGIPLSPPVFIIACLVWYGLDTKEFIAAKKNASQIQDPSLTESQAECASANEGLAFFFRVAFVYLGFSTLALWALNVIAVYSRWTVMSSAPGFNKEEFMLRVGVSLIASLFFAWVLWQAREGRSVKLLCVALGYALLGAVVMVMYSMVHRPPAGETNALYSTLRWLGVIVSGKGHPIGWVIATLRLFSCPISKSLFGALNVAQQIFTVGLFSFALAKQPERIATNSTF